MIYPSNRPLSYTLDVENVEALTPNKLIYGRNINIEVENNETNEIIEPDITKRAVYLRKLLDHFWKRWNSEYLINLREYHKNKNLKNELTPNVGDVVLIFDDKIKRSQWRMGRIHNLIYSRDGKVRAADVSVCINNKRNSLRRPINRLYPFEMNREKDNNCTKIKFVDEKDIITFLAVAGSV